MDVVFRRAKSRISYRFRNARPLRWVVLALLFFLLSYMVRLYNNSFKPILKQLSETNAYYHGTAAINEGTLEVLNKNDINYEDLITFIKDPDGNVTALMSNLIAINRLKGEFTLTINEKINNLSQIDVRIPVGNLTGVELFSGMGPRVLVKLVPAGTTLVDFKNSFTAAGINQTKHEINLEVRARIAILMPNNISSVTEVVSNIPIAQSIVVGKVPDSYTNVETKEEDLRADILDIVN